MPERIRPIQNPSSIINEIPPPVVSQIDVPFTRTFTPTPPVVRGIKPPVVRVPNPTIEYPQIEITRPVPRPPKEEQKEEEEAAPVPPSQEDQTTPTDTRELPDTPSPPQVPTQTPQMPTVEVGGLEIPLPEPEPLVAAGSLAVVTTVVTLGATIAVNQAKQALEPFLRRALSGGKKKKIKVKKVTPVLHFIPNDDGTTDLLEYSQKGMKVLESSIEKLEQYLRDQVEIDALWEYDNKIIIDEELSKQLTKEGQKRFKKYLVSPKVVAKKLGAKFVI